MSGDSPYSTSLQLVAEQGYALASADNPICGSVDDCGVLMESHGGSYLWLKGWLCHINEMITVLQVGIAGSEMVLARRYDRDDVARDYPNLRFARLCGYEARIPLHGEHRDPITVFFLATLSDGLTISGSFPVIPRRPTSSAEVSTPCSGAAGVEETHMAVRDVALQTFLTSGARVEFNPCVSPTVSVLIPIYNQAALTLACLQSLRESRGVDLEVILIDNGSDDLIRKLLDRVDGARIVRNDENEYFVRASNRGARLATGKYLLFLNSDTALDPCAIGAALKTIVTEERVGAVGARLVRFDGRLQEAGSIVWSGGVTSGYGRGENPWAAEYLFRRDTDYCSAAFLLTLRDLFLSSGMFDESYSPAYYEDVDYCVRLREMNYRVIYEPRAVVFHKEFSSADTESALKLQGEKRQIFVEKHREYIKTRPKVSDYNPLTARWGGARPETLLFIEDQIPLVEKGSGFPRTYEMIKLLSSMGYAVTLYPVNAASESWEDIFEEIPPSVEVMIPGGRENFGQFLRERISHYDRVIVSRPHNMDFFCEMLAEMEGGIAPDLPEITYDAEAIYAIRDIQQAAIRSGKYIREGDVEQILQKEIDTARLASKIISVSEAEAEEFRKRGLDNTHVLAYPVDVSPTSRSFEDRRGILGLGPIYDEESPNADGVVWFLDEVFPHVLSTVDAGLTFKMAGVNKVASIRARENENVEFLGVLPELFETFDKARIFVAPVRFAAGISLKLITAAAYGVPAVCSAVVARQLGWRDEEEVLVASTPEAFSKKCQRLYTDKALWTRLRHAAAEAVRREFSRENFFRQLRNIMEGDDEVSIRRSGTSTTFESLIG